VQLTASCFLFYPANRCLESFIVDTVWNIVSSQWWPLEDGCVEQ